MSKRYEIEITGDTGGLQRASERATKLLDGVAKAASGGGFDIGGGLNSITQTLQGVSRSAGLANAGMGALSMGLTAGAAVFTAAAAAGYAMLKTVGEAANKLNELSAASGMSVTQIQKLEGAYRGLGIEAEKLVDINKDVKDKMGEMLHEGTGEMAGIAEAWNIPKEKFAEFQNQADGGHKALIRMYFEMKKAGASQAELTRAMEAMGDEASALGLKLGEYKSEQEALNAINSQSAAISEETAAAYKESDANLTRLTSGAMSLGSEIAGPVMEALNWLFAYFDRDWSNLPFVVVIKKMTGFLIDMGKAGIDTMTSIGKGIRDYVFNPLMKGLSKLEPLFKALSKQFPGLAEIVKDMKDGVVWYVEDTVKIMSNTNLDGRQAKLEDAAKKQAEKQAQEQKVAQHKKSLKDQKEAEKAAKDKQRQQEALYKKMMEARQKAHQEYKALNVAIFGETQATIASQNGQLQENLNKLDNVLAQGLISHEKYAEMRAQLIETNSRNFKSFLLGAEPEVFFQTLTTLKEAYQQDLDALKSQLDNKLITIEQYNQRKKDIEESFKQKEGMYAQVAGAKTAEMNADTVSLDNPYAQAALEQINLKQELNSKLEELDNMRDLSEKQREERRLALLKSYRQREADIEQRTADLKLQSTESMFGEMAKTASGFFGKNNKLAKAAFLAEKGLAIGRATMNAQVAASKAMAELPFPMNYVESGLAYAKVAGMVASLKQTEVSGMAHDGIDNIPREGTWLLDRGERVVDQRTNGDLKDFLKSQKSGESSQPIQVHAPLTIQGSVSSDDARVMEAIKRHPAMVAAAVQDAQRRRM